MQCWQLDISRTQELQLQQQRFLDRRYRNNWMYIMQFHGDTTGPGRVDVAISAVKLTVSD